jgi:rhamnosyltransferase subunit B
MRFLVSALGSAGDVHPFIAISRVLRERGHEVRMLASAHFEERIRRSGIDFTAMGTSADYERLLTLPDLWHPRRGVGVVLDELLNRLAEAYEITAAATTPDTVLVGSSLSWAARLIRERTGQALATVHLSPTLLLSAVQPSVMPAVGDLGRMPPWLVRILHRAADRWVLDRLAAPRLDRLRADLGLPPVRRIWSRWMHSPDRVICAWPAWFAAPQPDWPPRSVVTGFPIFDEGRTEIEASLDAFLAAGPAPVGITPGSAMAHGERFLARALDATIASGRRALLITPFRDQLPGHLPDGAHQIDYASFSTLLPRLSMLVHHGGIGTSAQALAAGIAQIVVPFAHDQFDNAARLRRLGVSRTLRVTSSVGEWSAAIRELTGSQDSSRVVGEFARRLAHEPPGASQAADQIEALGRAMPGRADRSRSGSLAS